MECQTSTTSGPEVGGLLPERYPDQPVSFMDYNRSFARPFQAHPSYETAVTTQAMMTTNPLCYLSGQFMDIKSMAGRSPAVLPGAVHPATNFYRGAPFPELPFSPLGGFQQPPTVITPREGTMAINPMGDPREHMHNYQGLRNYPDMSEKARTIRHREDDFTRGDTYTATRPSPTPSPGDRPSHSPDSSPLGPNSSPPLSPGQDECSPPAHRQDDHNEDSPTESKKYPDYCRTLVVKDASGATKELVFPKALDLDRPKRARTTFSAEQLYHLEREFNRNQYLVGKERTDLAHTLHLSETQVKVWFQNRRTKYKRDKQREQEERSANAESIAACNILRILQPKHPQGGATNPSMTSQGAKEESQFHHNPFLPPSLSGAPPPTNHMLGLRPPFYAP